MKPAFAFALLGLVFLTPLKAQWQQIPTGSTYDLNCISFYGDDHIWVGTAWDILTSHNGGDSWQARPLVDALGVQMTLDVTGVHLTGPNEGVATGWFYLGNNQLVLKSVDDFQSWTFAYNNAIGAPFEKVINDWQFPTPTTGYAVGDDVPVIKTEDGGDSWSQQVLQGNSLEDVDFIDEQHGIAVGKFTTMRTSNGGANWQVADHPEYLYAVAMASQQKIYAAHSNNGFLRSDDGGDSWQLLTPPSGVGINCLESLGPDTLLVGTTNGIYLTTADGLYWHHFTETAGIEVSNIAKNGSIWWATCRYGLLLRSNNLNTGKPQPLINLTIDSNCAPNSVVSANAGNPDWSYQWFFNDSLISAEYNLDWVIVVDSLSYITGTLEVIATDGQTQGSANYFLDIPVHPGVEVSMPNVSKCSGEFIQLQAPTGYQYQWTPWEGITAHDLADPYFVGDTTITYTIVAQDWFCTDTFQMKVEVNPYVPFENWTATIDPPYIGGIRQIDFPDPLHGYGINRNNGLQFVFTEDGGQTWGYRSPFPDVRPFADLDFINADTGFVANAQLFRTMDGGEHFEPIDVPTTNFANEVVGLYFKDANLGFAWTGTNFGSIYGSLFKVTQMGGTVQEVLTPGFVIATDMVCPTNEVCYLAGIHEFPATTDKSPLFKSTDGGSTWAELPFPYPKALVSIEAIHPDTIVALGQQSEFYKSTDGGITWSRKYLSSAAVITGGGYNYGPLAMVTPNKIYAATILNGKKMLSEDGGECWQVMDMNEVNDYFIFDFSFPTADVGYVAMDHLAVPYSLGNVFKLNDLPFFKLDGAPCPGESVHFENLSPSCYSNFQWFLSGTLISTEFEPTITLGSPGTYVFELRATNEAGQIKQYVKTISVLPAPESPVLDTPPTYICLLGDNILSVNSPEPGYSYQWSSSPANVSYVIGNGSTGNVYLFDHADSVTVNVAAVNENGCIGPITVHAFPVGPDKPYFTQQPFGPDYLDCFVHGDTVEMIFTAQAANVDGLNWQVLPDGLGFKEEIGNTLYLSLTNVVDFGYMDVNAIASNECGTATSNTWEVFTSPAPIFVESPRDTSIFEGESALLKIVSYAENGASYTWYHDGVEVLGANGKNLEINPASLADDGKYWCTMTGVCGIIYSDTATVTVVLTPVDEQKQTLINLEITPNPCDKEARIAFKNGLPGNGRLSLRNSLGQQVLIGSVANDKEVRMDTQQLSNGMYILEISSGAAVSSIKMVVKHKN